MKVDSASALEKRHPQEKRALGDLGSDTRGAVLVEFTVAIMPILIAFFSFIQMAKVAQARIILKHAAIVSARAGAVMVNSHNNTPGEPVGVNEGTVLQAATAALGPWWGRGFSGLQVQVTDSSTEADPYGWVNVVVVGTYECTVPLGKLICGGSKQMTEQAQMPHQGANYKL